MSNIISLDDYKRRKREERKSKAQKIREALNKYGSLKNEQRKEELRKKLEEESSKIFELDREDKDE